MQLLPLALFLSLSVSAHAAQHQCSLNDFLKFGGKNLDISAQFQSRWLFGHHITSAQYNYETEDGTTLSGQLNCDQRETQGYQVCLPKDPDPILEKISVTKFGLFVQLKGQPGYGPMQCTKAE